MKIRARAWCAAVCTAVCAAILPTVAVAQDAPAPDEKPAQSMFKGSDGAFDVSGFLNSKVGFLPVAMPITEPAVGYGLGVGLTFFHERPPIVKDPDGQERTIFPTLTAVFGATTENGTWAGAVAHLHQWDDGRIKYLGAAGYAALNLDWFGRSDALGGRSINYTCDVTFIQQQVNFQLGDSKFYLGPQQRFLSTDSQFAFATFDSGIPRRQLDSKTSGLGLDFGYDSRDQPFSPNKGIRASLSYSQQAEWLGGDFNYGKLRAYGMFYVPFRPNLVLGVYANGAVNIGDAPFYDLPMIQMRGIPLGRYVDNAEAQIEAELRWDFVRRWSIVGFGGVGRVAGSVGHLLDADNHAAAGAGVRYLIAEQYGLRMGVDLAHADSEWTIYVSVGTGWPRP
jgi:hypothetical protein